MLSTATTWVRDESNAATLIRTSILMFPLCIRRIFLLPGLALLIPLNLLGSAA